MKTGTVLSSLLTNREKAIVNSLNNKILKHPDSTLEKVQNSKVLVTTGSQRHGKN